MRHVCTFALSLVLPLGVFADELKLTKDELAVVELTNKERKACGLCELTPNPQLFEAARTHTLNMASQNKLQHTLDGKSAGERVRAVGYRSGGTGENIAWNQRSATDVVRCWMNSAGHRANILNAGYTEIGIGIAYNSKGELYWTQVFGKPSR
jgi:uncharacterized protein YkwD